MKKLREKRGSITLFVLLAMLFFVIVLVGIFISVTNYESAKNLEQSKTKDIYEKNVENVDEIYNEIIEQEGQVNLKEEYPGVTTWIPIYTRAQLEKVGSGSSVLVSEENKSYTFSSSATVGYILKNDIDLSGTNWTPLPTFYGVLYGNNKELLNMTINLVGTNQGFFTYNYGTIRNITLKNVNMIVGTYAGGVAGYNYGTIQECYVTGKIESTSTATITQLGGITGYNMASSTTYVRQNCEMS